MPDVIKKEDVKDMNDFRHWGLPKPAIEVESENAMGKVRRRMYDVLDKPVTYIRENFVKRLQANNKQVYYHRRYPRVPTIDECVEGDQCCYYEANHQMKRDKAVDGAIVRLLRQRKNDCFLYEGDDWAKNCHKEMEDYEDALTNHFIRYGEVGHFGTAVDMFMRQKHRMVWERRNPDKVDFMYARERQENRYVVPVEKGQFQSPQVPDNSRSRYRRNEEL